MALTFRYKTIKRPDGTETRTPSIPITLIGKNKKFDAIALIDSGADVSAISEDIADILEIDKSGELQPAFGIGGKVDAVESTIKIIIEKGHEHYNLTIPVKVILGKHDFPVLLGRAGFFEQFKITFIESDRRIEFKKAEMLGIKY